MSAARPAAQYARRLIRTPLTGPALFTWIALRRVHAGGLARFEGRYYDSGRRVPDHLPFDALFAAGLLTFTKLDPDNPVLRRIALTREGRAQFAALSERRQSQALSAGERVLSCGNALCEDRVGFCGE